MDALHLQLDLFLTGGTYHNATCRYANYVHPEQPLYPARIQSFSLSRELPDPLVGGLAKRSASITLSDKDFQRLDSPTLAAILATENPKGKRARLRLWDPASGTTLDTLNGIISSIGQDYRSLTIEGEDPALLQKLLPTTRALDIYPSLDTSQMESRDPPPIVVFGPMPRVTLGLALATYVTFTAVMGGTEGDKYVYADLTAVPNYVVAAGDRLVYDLYYNAAGNQQALDLRCSDGTVLRNTAAMDQNGLGAGPAINLDAYAALKWYRRDIDLTPLVGKTITEYMLGAEKDSAGTYSASIAYAYILAANETKKVVIFDETITTVPLAYQSRNNTATTASAVIDRNWFYGPIRPDATTGNVTCTAVYVDGRVRESSAYAFVYGNGFHFVRFGTRPQASQGGPAKVQADLNSTEFVRNPANVMQYIWGDSTMLAQSVNAASFTVAASTYADIGDYEKLVGGLAERKQALQILRDLNFRGAYFDLNDSGEVTITVDAAAQHVAAPVNLGQNDDLNLRNAELETNNSLSSSIADQLKQLDFLAYRDPGLGTNAQASYLISATRSRSVGGATITRESPFCGSGKMADREGGYLFKALVAGDLDIAVRTGVTIGKQLTLGQLVKFYSPKQYFSGSQYLIQRIRFDGKNYSLRLTGWDATLFTYTPGKITVSRLVDALIDYSQTTPSTPTSPTYISSTVTIGSDGTTTTVEKFRVTLPAVNCTALHVFCYRTGTAQADPFLTVVKNTVVLGAANDVEVIVPAGISYDIEFYAYNGANNSGFRFSLPALITGRVAAGDTTAPAQVTGVLLAAAPPGNIRVRWTTVTAGDIKKYEIQSATDSGFSANVVTRESLSTETTLTGLTPLTVYWVRVRAKDFSGNPTTDTGWSGASTPASLAAPRTGTDDIGDDTIINGKIANLTITGAKIANATITDAQIGSLNAGKITTGLLTVNPSSGGATAILVDNAGKIRLKSIIGTPSKIVFENSSGGAEVEITGTTGGINFVPVTSGQMVLSLGQTGAVFASASVYAQTSFVTGTTSVEVAGGTASINGTTALSLLGPWRTNQVVGSAPGGALNKYIQLKDTNGNDVGRIAIYS
jgi:hypothetical protein